MKRYALKAEFLVAAFAIWALAARADYDVLGVTENGGVERYAVSADGNTWTKASSFAFANGAVSDPQVAQAIVPPHESRLSQSHKCFSSVVAATLTNGTVCTMGASKSRYAGHGERILLSTNGTAAAYCGALGFPGGSKPFSVVWDGTTRRYWMVTAACHRGDRSAAVPPDTLESGPYGVVRQEHARTGQVKGK